MVIDDMAVLAASLRRPAAPQAQQVRGAEEAVEPVVVEVNIQTVADQALSIAPFSCATPRLLREGVMP